MDVHMCAERGAEFLDEIRPGWEREINTETLQMSHILKCVLGQLFGHYDEACEQFGFQFEDAVAMGFDLEEDFSGNIAAQWATLTNTWIDAIDERLSLADAA